jgi:hypothetical protein
MHIHRRNRNLSRLSIPLEKSVDLQGIDISSLVGSSAYNWEHTNRRSRFFGSWQDLRGHEDFLQRKTVRTKGTSIIGINVKYSIFICNGYGYFDDRKPSAIEVAALISR